MRMIGWAAALVMAAGGAGAETLRIAAWNIEHLVAEDGAGCAPRDADGFARVRDVIDAVDADVWLLQEVEGAAALARILDPADWAFHVSGRPALGRFSACRGDPDQSLAMQATAIAVRRGVAHDRLPDLEDLDLERNGRQRWGTAIRLTGGAQPVDLLNVHLVSGCFFGFDRPSCPVLFGQLPIVRQWLDARAADGVPAIVAGDFNRRMELSDDRFWRILNADSRLHIAGPDARPRCLKRYDEFIDFIVLDDAAMALKVPASFVETTFTVPTPLFPSDHCPIHVDLQLGE